MSDPAAPDAVAGGSHDRGAATPTVATGSAETPTTVAGTSADAIARSVGVEPTDRVAPDRHGGTAGPDDATPEWAAAHAPALPNPHRGRLGGRDDADAVRSAGLIGVRDAARWIIAVSGGLGGAVLALPCGSAATPPETEALAVATVDRAVDGGAHLLVLRSGDAAADVAGRAVIAAHTGAEPVDVVPATSPAWAADVVAVRAALRAVRPHAYSAGPALTATGSPTLRWMTAAVEQAARRATPVLIDGAAAHAAVVLADLRCPGAAGWVLRASRGDVASQRAGQRLHRPALFADDDGLPCAGLALAALAAVADDPSGAAATEPRSPAASA